MPRIARGLPSARRIARAISMGHYQRSLVLGVWFGGDSSMLVFETEFEWGWFVMAHDFEQKYVALVASIIGAVVLVLGLGGILFNIS